MTMILLRMLPLLCSDLPPITVNLQCLVALADGPILVMATITNTANSNLVVYERNPHEPSILLKHGERRETPTINHGSIRGRIREVTLAKDQKISVVVPVHHFFSVKTPVVTEAVFTWRFKNSSLVKGYVTWCSSRISINIAAPEGVDGRKQLEKIKQWCGPKASEDEKALCHQALNGCTSSECAAIAREFLDRQPAGVPWNLFRAGFGQGKPQDLGDAVEFLCEPGRRHLRIWVRELRSMLADEGMRLTNEQVEALTEKGPILVRLAMYIELLGLFTPEAISRLHFDASRFRRSISPDQIAPLIELLKSDRYRVRAEAEARLVNLEGSALNGIQHALNHQRLDPEQSAVLKRVIGMISRPISMNLEESSIAKGLIDHPHCKDLLAAVLLNDKNCTIVRAIYADMNFRKNAN